jgi:hypothetical protein
MLLRLNVRSFRLGGYRRTWWYLGTAGGGGVNVQAQVQCSTRLGRTYKTGASSGIIGAPDELQASKEQERHAVDSERYFAMCPNATLKISRADVRTGTCSPPPAMCMPGLMFRNCHVPFIVKPTAVRNPPKPCPILGCSLGHHARVQHAVEPSFLSVLRASRAASLCEAAGRLSGR